MKHLFHPVKKKINLQLLRFSGVLKENHCQGKMLYFYLKKEIHNRFPKFVSYTIITFSYMCVHTLTQVHLIINTHIKNLG